MDTLHFKKGYVTLLSVIVVAALASAITFGFLSRGISASKNTSSFEAAIRSRVLADICAEIALQKIRDEAQYTIEKASVISVNGNCTYTIKNLGGNRRSIITTGYSGSATKNLDVEVDGINPYIIILSWREVE
jgi:hypothetical protein